MPKLSIIILSYNTADITKECINSITKSINIDAEVIVVDNGSSDNSVKMLQQFKISNFKFKIILNDTNLGYPKGNNQGLKYAVGKYILFLNSDVIIKKINFKQLLRYFDSRPDVGVLTVKVALPNGEIDPASHRGFPTIWNSFCYFMKLEKLFGKVPVLNKMFGGYHLINFDLQTIHEIDSPTGAFYLTRKSVLDEVGGFDESFFMYGEDLDLSFRIKELGLKVLYYPLYKVVHLKYASGLNHTDNKNRLQIKNHFYNAMKVFYRKHYEKKYSSLVNNFIYWLIELKKKIS